MSAKKSGGRGRSVVTTRRGPSLVMIVGIVVVLVFAGAVGYGIYRTQQGTAAQVPPGATASGIAVGQADAKATIDIYQDYQCPVCRAYEQQVGPTIDKLINSGAAKVVYHPLAFLDRMSSTNYSTRASSAAGCVAGSGPQVFYQFNKLLYANQPEEGGSGLPGSKIIALAGQAGAAPSVADCINGKTYAKWAKALTESASRAGVNATPTVMVNGKQIENTVTALEQAVRARQ
jgi:protein-disulfide isomerase